MAQTTQTYKTHRRYIPVYHFFIVPVLLANVIVAVLRLNSYRTGYKAWELVVAVALFIFAFAARGMALRAQERAIRIEERARISSLVPENMRGRVGDLTSGQLIALRFASDEEIPDLAQRCFIGELTKNEEIKKQIRTWRPDLHRV